MVACGSGPQEDTADNSIEKETEVEEEVSKSDKASVGESFSTGEFQVTLDSISKDTDQNGSEFATLHFSFTNNSESEASFMNNILVESFQNDISLSATPDTGNMIKQNYITSAVPGETVEDITLSFYTRDTSPLTIEVQAVSELGLSEPVSIEANIPQ